MIEQAMVMYTLEVWKNLEDPKPGDKIRLSTPLRALRQVDGIWYHEIF